METDVNSPTSTCTSEVSFSVESSESDQSSEEESSESNQSCIICFCSDEEIESHDCTVCKEGAWKICKKCKEKMKRIDKCPVCMTENLNYEEPSPPRPQNIVVRERNFILVDLIIRGLWKDVLIECFMYFFKLCFCILYSIIGLSAILLVSYLTKSSHCFLQIFLGIVLSIIWGIVALTIVYDPGDESGRLYRLCFAPILSIMFLTLSGLVNGYCAVFIVDRTEVLIVGGVCLFLYSFVIWRILIEEET